MQPKTRLTVVDNVYYQRPDDKDATQSESHFYRWLDTEEQVYQREARVGSDWALLDTGWIERVSMLSIRNDEKLPESEEETPKLLFLSLNPEGLGRIVIRPGASARFGPDDLNAVRVSASEDKVRFSYFLFPG